MPVVPPPSRYVFDASGADEGEDLVGVGADLAPGTVLEAYARGLFPMGLGAAGAPPIGWWSPDPRGILRPGDFHVSRSLRRSLRHFEVRLDTDFAGVVAGCADPGRSGRWITPEIVAAYSELHRMGWAHSIEVRRDGELVGGLYGIAIGGLFAGESMFHRRDGRVQGGRGGAGRPRGRGRRPTAAGRRPVAHAAPGVARRDGGAAPQYLRLLADALTAPLPAPFR